MQNQNKENREKVREEKLKNFNENESGLYHNGIFGLPFDEAESELVILPVPWEATVSYMTGAEKGPEAILKASSQIDLYDPVNEAGWQKGIHMLKPQTKIKNQSKKTRAKVEKYLAKYFKGKIDTKLQKEINKECEDLKNYVKKESSQVLNEDKILALLGGDHSTPLGYYEALSEKYNDFGILHIDAHQDLRNAYEGFTYSHASIFYNALKIKNISKLVQVGIRDFCKEEKGVAEKEKNRVVVFTDYEIKKEIFKGATWDKICDKIVGNLPANVYISFDIDGLLPYLAENTGTPVAGGFTIDEMVYLFEKVLESGRRIIGFDLCEVAPGKTGEWDGNVGARVLYKLCLLALKSKFK